MITLLRNNTNNDIFKLLMKNFNEQHKLSTQNEISKRVKQIGLNYFCQFEGLCKEITNIVEKGDNESEVSKISSDYRI